MPVLYAHRTYDSDSESFDVSLSTKPETWEENTQVFIITDETLNKAIGDWATGHWKDCDDYFLEEVVNFPNLRHSVWNSVSFRQTNNYWPLNEGAAGLAQSVEYFVESEWENLGLEQVREAA